jgi:hypothetical protein
MVRDTVRRGRCLQQEQCHIGLKEDVGTMIAEYWKNEEKVGMKDG